MNRHQLRSWGVVGFAATAGLCAGNASAAYSAPPSTPPGITIADVSTNMGSSIPLFLWRRLGDAEGNPLYTYDADQGGQSSCYAECAKQFPPLAALAHAKPSGDFTILVRDDRVRQWVYQGKPLYRYSGRDPIGEPKGNGAIIGNAANPAWHDPGSSIYSPRPDWRRAAYAPEKSIRMPPVTDLEGLAVADGFGFVDAATHLTLYAAPVAHQLSNDWRPVRASALALPVGEFAITRRSDRTRQWTYRGEALYTYSGDYAPGEVTGIFTGDKSVHAALAYQNFIPTGIEIRHLVTQGPLMTVKGQALYYVARFFPLYGARETRAGYGITYNDAKSQGTAGCQDQCTQTWKPLLAATNDQADGFWEIATRPDGSRQWIFKGSPVYTFVGDTRPGDITGNNRHVIVYGGSNGQIIYADAGGDSRDMQPRIDKNLSMAFAEGPAPIGLPNAGASTTGNPPAGGPHTTGADDLGTTAAAVRYRGAGAGLYWHTVSLFY